MIPRASVTTAVQGRRPSTLAVRHSAMWRRGGYVARRARWAGRGWPVRVLVSRGVVITGTGQVLLGTGVHLNERTWLHAEPDARLAIGPGTAIGRDSLVTAAGNVSIGANVLFGPQVLMTDNSHGSRKSVEPYIRQPLIVNGSISVQEGVWIGMGASIISGRDPLVVGAGAIIGANAVVRHSVAPRSVVAPGSVHEAQR